MIRYLYLRRNRVLRVELGRPRRIRNQKGNLLRQLRKKSVDKDKRPTLLDLGYKSIMDLATHRGVDSIVSGARKKKTKNFISRVNIVI